MTRLQNSLCCCCILALLRVPFTLVSGESFCIGEDDGNCSVLSAVSEVCDWDNGTSNDSYVQSLNVTQVDPASVQFMWSWVGNLSGHVLLTCCSCVAQLYMGVAINTTNTNWTMSGLQANHTYQCCLMVVVNPTNILYSQSNCTKIHLTVSATTHSVTSTIRPESSHLMISSQVQASTLHAVVTSMFHSPTPFSTVSSGAPVQLEAVMFVCGFIAAVLLMVPVWIVCIVAIARTKRNSSRLKTELESSSSAAFDNPTYLGHDLSTQRSSPLNRSEQPSYDVIDYHPYINVTSRQHFADCATYDSVSHSASSAGNGGFMGEYCLVGPHQREESLTSASQTQLTHKRNLPRQN